MYINAGAGSAMLYLQHGFCNIISKIRHKLYAALGPPQGKILGAHLVRTTCCLHLEGESGPELVIDGEVSFKVFVII
jgi:hypothetical protein